MIEPDIVLGENGLPKLILAAPDGARAEIYLHGAHVTSWIPAGSDERLFLSPRAEFSSDKAIRGGVPIIFPQFDREGSLPRHGFARTAEWSVVTVTANSAMLRLTDSEATHALWPGHFSASLMVTLNESQLGLSLVVSNTGSAPFTFTCALHTYLRVVNIDDVRVEGLHGVRYSDKVLGGNERIEDGELLHIRAETDRIYFDVPDAVAVHEPASARMTEVSQSGFTDVVVWNPWDRAATLPDMEPDGYKHMLCVEAATIGKPAHLEPDAIWSSTQILTAK